jgi:hypothetical protein
MNKPNQLNNLDEIMIDIMIQQYKEAEIELPKVDDDFNQVDIDDNILSEVEKLEGTVKSKKSLWGICSDFLTVAALTGSVASVIVYDRQAPIVEFDESFTHYICGDNVNVREGASIAESIVGQLDTGVGITVIGSDGNWAIVEWENGSAYISYSYLQLVEKQGCLRRNRGISL